MPWVLNIRLDLPFLKEHINYARRFLKVSSTQIKVRIGRQDEVIENRDIVLSLLEAKDPKTDRQFNLPELVSETTLLLIAGN